MNEKILIVDDEESIRYTYRNFLEEAGYEVYTAENVTEAKVIFEKTVIDLVYLDIVLNSISGIDLLKKFKGKNPSCQVIIVTGAPTVETASEAVRFGALDYIVKPIRQDTLLRSAAMALRHKAVADSREIYRKNIEAIFRSVKDGIISVDKDMNILEMNRSAAAICRVSRDACIGKNFSRIALECGAGCIAALQKTLVDKKTVEIDYLECRAADQKDQTVGLSATPMLGGHNEFTGAVMLVRDQTRLLQLERSLKAHTEFDSIVGKSHGIQKIFSLIRDLSNVQTSVLITGESGTGKELVASAIQNAGDRSDKPYVKVNCAALTENLLESELFGHVRGAFTGAIKDKIGRFERADGGTIFLDEIAEMPNSMQLRFLRVIEEMEIEPVGGSKVVKVDVRVIAATNQDLSRKVKEGSFREDLFYRLNVVQIKMPSLRERRDDIPLLIKHFLTQFNKKFGREIKGVSNRVMDQFMNYAWPGNVRELKNTLEHSFILCRNNCIDLDDLPYDFLKSENPRLRNIEMEKNEQLSPESIESALKKTSGNKTHAARLLGISRRTIYRKMDEFNILH